MAERASRAVGLTGRTAGLVTLAAACAILLIVRLADLILMIFASVLTAMLLSALARPLQQKLRMSRPVALIATITALSGVAVLISWLFGTQFSAQTSSLTVLLPKSWLAFKAQLGETSLGRLALDQIRSAKWPDNFLLTWATRFAGNVASTVFTTVMVVAGAIYLAFHPETYRGGLLRLAPRPHRARAAEVLEACRRALTQWLVGQTVSMCFIALTTSIGLWIAGVPSPLALGVLAGLGHAVPVIGPWATALPGLLVAAAQGPQTLWVATLTYLLTSQLESNVLMPLVLRQMSSVPMAVTLFAVVAMGALFGPLGVLLATPLAVLAYVLVREVYLADLLGDPPESGGGSISSRPAIT
jgi:predicted PurR-regulated permease PerM